MTPDAALLIRHTAFVTITFNQRTTQTLAEGVLNSFLAGPQKLPHIETLQEQLSSLSAKLGGVSSKGHTVAIHFDLGRLTWEQLGVQLDLIREYTEHIIKPWDLYYSAEFEGNGWGVAQQVHVGTLATILNELYTLTSDIELLTIRALPDFAPLVKGSLVV